MTYTGLEIDMLAIGDADSILISNYANGVVTRVLIDGGYQKDAPKIIGFLNTRRISFIDHVVCSHPHADHAGGLIELVKDESLSIGCFWCHVPDNHVDVSLVKSAARIAAETTTARMITESLKTTEDLISAVRARRIPLQEPFANASIGFIQVLSPSAEYYESFLSSFTTPTKLQAINLKLKLAEAEILIEAMQKTAAEGDGLLDDPQTSPENNSAVVCGTLHDNRVYLFTSDAGAEPLRQVASSYQVKGLRWMQIPHHGSRHNITKELINHFSPETAFVSAEGNVKHPRRAVVNAFKSTGSNVYSTHYPSNTDLWHHNGNVPDRPAYGPATPLYEAN